MNQHEKTLLKEAKQIIKNNINFINLELTSGKYANCKKVIENVLAGIEKNLGKEESDKLKNLFNL